MLADVSACLDALGFVPDDFLVDHIVERFLDAGWVASVDAHLARSLSTSINGTAWRDSINNARTALRSKGLLSAQQVINDAKRMLALQQARKVLSELASEHTDLRGVHASIGLQAVLLEDLIGCFDFKASNRVGLGLTGHASALPAADQRRRRSRAALTIAAYAAHRALGVSAMFPTGFPGVPLRVGAATSGPVGTTEAAVHVCIAAGDFEPRLRKQAKAVDYHNLQLALLVLAMLHRAATAELSAGRDLHCRTSYELVGAAPYAAWPAVVNGIRTVVPAKLPWVQTSDLRAAPGRSRSPSAAFWTLHPLTDVQMSIHAVSEAEAEVEAEPDEAELASSATATCVGEEPAPTATANSATSATQAPLSLAAASVTSPSLRAAAVARSQLEVHPRHPASVPLPRVRPAAAASVSASDTGLPDTLAPGTRAQKGIDWKADDEGGVGVGTVMEHLGAEGFTGYYTVEWGDGAVAVHKYTSNHRSLAAAAAGASAAAAVAGAGAATSAASATVAVAGAGEATSAAVAPAAATASSLHRADLTQRRDLAVASQSGTFKPTEAAPLSEPLRIDSASPASSLPSPHRHLPARLPVASSALGSAAPAPGSLRWVQLMRSMAYALAAAPPAHARPSYFGGAAAGAAKPASMPRRHAPPSVGGFAANLAMLKALTAQVQPVRPASAATDLDDLRRRVAELEKARESSKSSGLAARLQALESNHGKMSNQLGYLAEKTVLASQSRLPIATATGAQEMHHVRIQSLGDALAAVDVSMDADGVNALALRILTPVLPAMLLAFLSEVGRERSADHPQLSALLHVLRANRGITADALARYAGVMRRLRELVSPPDGSRTVTDSDIREMVTCLEAYAAVADADAGALQPLPQLGHRGARLALSAVVLLVRQVGKSPRFAHCARELELDGLAKPVVTMIPPQSQAGADEGSPPSYTVAIRATEAKTMHSGRASNEARGQLRRNLAVLAVIHHLGYFHNGSAAHAVSVPHSSVVYELTGVVHFAMASDIDPAGAVQPTTEQVQLPWPVLAPASAAVLAGDDSVSVAMHADTTAVLRLERAFVA